MSENNSSRYYIIICYSCNAALNNAQDDHYRSQQYGAGNTLPLDAMAGGAPDSAAVYYNPGAMTFITILSLSIDANGYGMDKTLITDSGRKGS